MSTTFQISEDTMKKVADSIKENMDKIEDMKNSDASLTCEEVAQSILIDSFDDIAQIEAEDIVNDLKKGISEFEAELENSKDASHANTAEILSKELDGKTEDEKKRCYANVLTALQFLNSESITKEMMQEAMNANMEKTTEDLIAEIEASSATSDFVSGIMEGIGDDFNPEKLAELLPELNAENKSEIKFWSALWLYIEQRKGNLQLADGETRLPARMIGAIAVSGAELVSASRDVAEGKCDVKKWQVIVKWVLGTLLTVALAIIVASTVFALGVAAPLFVISVMGTSTFALLVAMLICILVSVKSGEFMSDAMMNIINRFSEFYDKHILGITEKVKSWWNMFREWCSGAVEKVKVKIETAAESINAGSNDNRAETQRQEQTGDNQNIQFA